jgi:hypothetical protein
MSSFHLRLAALQGELWRNGWEASPDLAARLTALSTARLPAGVARLPGAKMSPGPHLEPQSGRGGGNVCPFEPPQPPAPLPPLAAGLHPRLL